MHITKSHIAKTFAVLTVSMSVAGSAQADAATCANSNLVPSKSNVSEVRKATLCLINNERASRGIAKLRTNGKLGSIARSYAERMGREHFFSHTAPDRSTEA